MKYLIVTIMLAFAINVKAGDSLLLKIHFPFNKYELTTDAQKSVDSFFVSFDTTKVTIDNIVIYGHTDQLGSVDYNTNLSLQRAGAVVNYLKQKNESIVIKNVTGFGKSQLITTDTSDDKRLLNRRVEIIVYIKKKLISNPIVPPVKIDTIKKAEEVKTYNPPKKIKEILADTNIKAGDTVELPYILFIGGLAEFLPVSYPHLDELFFAMKDNPNLEIEIQGHVCCSKGEEDGEDFRTGRFNLSVARAKAVYDFLTISGINKKRLNYVGFGHRFPLTQERTDAEKARNRRVEVKIIKK